MSSANYVELLQCFMKAALKTTKKPNFFFLLCLLVFNFLTQSNLEVKKEAGESPPSEAACLCSPPPAKNQCASCGMDIQDRYLLKVPNLNLKKPKTSHRTVGINLRATDIPQ